MEVICIIPARGGSKRLLHKNVLPMAGKPLIAHSIEHALQSRLVERTLVSTDDDEIASVARRYGAEVVRRPQELGGDRATSESALVHVLDTVESQGAHPGLVLFLQCTSPVREPDESDKAIQALLADGADSLFSATPFRWLTWKRRDGDLESLNYDYRHRQREQEMEQQYRENGSIYVFKPWVLRKHNNRLGGKITAYEMDYWSSFQVDSLEDFQLCQWIMERQRGRECQGRFPSAVALVVFDFDGVLTDNLVEVHQDGTESVLCSRLDSLGISRLKEAGMPLLVLSTETNPVVGARCRKLGLECIQGQSNKLAALEKVLRTKGIDPSQVVYIGNDVNDVECMGYVGCGVAVGDAMPEAKDAAKIVLSKPGGRGAVRECCDLLLEHLGQARIPSPQTLNL